MHLNNKNVCTFFLICQRQTGKKVLPIFIGTGAESRPAYRSGRLANELDLTFLDTRKVTKEYAL
jgi:hypothetical protein